ncbi:MAG: hypothetical protein WCF88_16765 [Candidatus Acidiferrales bacterium]|jgi:hypothetical protein
MLDDEKKEQPESAPPVLPGETPTPASAPAVSPPATLPAVHSDTEPKRESPKEISIRILEESELTKLFERWSLVIAAVTLFTLFITFIVFYRQLKESQRQTELFRKQAEQAALDARKAQDQTRQQMELSKDSFRRDQQPYVWVTGIPTAEHFQSPGSDLSQILVSAHYKNFGKSPAIALQRYSLVEIGPKALQRVHSGRLTEAKSIIPPVEEEFFTSVTPPTKALPEMSRDDEIVLFTRLQYLDLLGHRYETDFCMSHLQLGPWHYCETHNEIKDCEKVACEP